MKRRDGFTLLELLVVIGLIALLMVLLLPAIMKSKENGKKQRIAANARALETAINAYKSRYHKWPGTDNDLDGGYDVVLYGTNSPMFNYKKPVFYPGRKKVFVSQSGGKCTMNEPDAGVSVSILCRENNKDVISRLSKPPDGTSGSDEPFLDLSDYVKDSHGNVLIGAGQRPYRIYLDAGETYTIPVLHPPSNWDRNHGYDCQLRLEALDVSVQ